MHVNRNIKINSPCYGCPYRYPGCHNPGSCLKEKTEEGGYTTYKKATEEERKAREERAIINNQRAAVRENSLKKAIMGK